MKLVRNAEVLSPEPLGKKDILIEGTKIAWIAERIHGYEEAEVIDASGLTLVPGYIDLHEHITGGGGEQGFASRVPEASLSLLIQSGVTTVLGLLGTDGITRSLENLLAKAREFQENGITAYILSGSYGYPPVTFTGSVERDLVLIPEVRGVKTAVSDHRSSDPQSKELIALGTAVRRGAMLAGKGGFVTMHMGSGRKGLDPLFKALAESDLPAYTFLPTHMLRTEHLMEQGLQFISMGGYMDCTAEGEEPGLSETADKLLKLISSDKDVIHHLTLSSDAFGSMPKFNEHMECIGLTYSGPQSLHETMKALVNKGLALPDAIRLLTINPAKVLHLSGKGRIAEGCDADFLLLNEKLNITSVYAKGRCAMDHGNVLMKGRFE
ncbi:MAG: beta-aspartyl-peptidase [Bulleidia sp.]|nr:beta-aspartyl-peptidase [Bulleidia sp.]